MQNIKKALFTLTSLTMITACEPGQDLDANTDSVHEVPEIQVESDEFVELGDNEGDEDADGANEAPSEVQDADEQPDEANAGSVDQDEGQRADLRRRDREVFCMQMAASPFREPGFDEMPRFPDDCDHGGPGGGGPPKGPRNPTRAPSVPSSIHYPNYSKGSSITVTWPSSAGYGFPVTYELYQRVGSGSWSRIYSGRSTRTTVSNLAKGKHRFKVRAKNTKYTSGYRQGALFVANPRKQTNLYAKYPFLGELDQRTKSYRSAGNTLRTSARRAKVQGQSQSFGVANGRMFLGDGYDVLRGTIKETCLDVSHPGFVINRMTSNMPSTFDVDYVRNNRHLSELLELSDTVRLGFSIDDVSLGLEAGSDHFAKTVTDSSHIRFVVKLKNRREFWNLSTPVDAIYPELVDRVLSPGDENAKRDFRERCGDNFVNSANLGSALYVVFDLDAKRFSEENRESHKRSIELALFDVFKGNGGTSSKNTLKRLISQLKIKVSAHQIGGPIGLAKSIMEGNVIEKIKQFDANNDRSNWAAVDFSTSLYQRPRRYSDHAHEDIFANYSGAQGPQAQMKRWADLTVQVQERCRPWEEYGKNEPSECGVAKTEMSIAIDLCWETAEWEKCVHPSRYRVGGDGSLGSSTHFFSWLSNNLDALEDRGESKGHRHHVHRGQKSVNDLTCLPSRDCFVNRLLGDGRGIANGFAYRQHEWDNPKGSSNRIWIPSGREDCVKATAFLKTGRPPFGDTTADWRYTLDVYGVCPVQQNFNILP